MRFPRAAILIWSAFRHGKHNELLPSAAEVEHYQTHRNSDNLNNQGLELFCRDFVWRLAHKNLGPNSAAITYNLILSLVPLLAIAFTFFQVFGGLDMFLKSVIFPHLQLYFRADNAATMQAYLKSIVSNIQTKTLGATALLTLLITVTTLLAAIEHAFNDIRESRKERSWLSRTLNYWLLLTLTPFVIVVSTAKSTEILTWFSNFLPISTLFNASYFSSIARRIGAFAIESAGFGLLYWVLPARRISTKAALLGGLIAGLGFESLQWINSYLSARVYREASLVQLYGSVPLIIVVLFVWLRLVSLVLLFGMVCAASWSRVFDQKSLLSKLHNPPAHGVYAVCDVFDAVVTAFQSNTGGITLTQLRNQFALTKQEAAASISWLIQQKLIAKAIIEETQGTLSELQQVPDRKMYVPTHRGLDYHLRPADFAGQILLDTPAAALHETLPLETRVESDAETSVEFPATIRRILAAYKPK
jgi:membrane protein